jgi:probable HAF family extracellular repeat protein
MGFFRKKFLVLLVVLSLLGTVAAGQSNYTVTDLGGLSGSRFANVSAINNLGQVVGTSANHAFLWENGAMTDLGTLGGTLSAANAINDRGQIVGESTTASGEKHAFLWEHGVMKDLGEPGETSTAHGINSHGEIVGAISGKNLRGGAVLWKAGGRQSLGDLGPSGSGSTALALNDNGEVVGVSSGLASNSGGVVRAVVWQHGVIQDVGTLGGLHSTASAINSHRQVAGWAEIADQSTVAFLFENGVMHDLGILPGGAIQPGSGSQAAALNALGQIVGSSVNSKTENRAVIWENGQIMDLNDGISAPTGVVFTRARAINNRGQIVVEQQSQTNSSTSSFLLTPRRLNTRTRDKEIPAKLP